MTKLCLFIKNRDLQYFKVRNMQMFISKKQWFFKTVTFIVFIFLIIRISYFFHLSRPEAEVRGWERNVSRDAVQYVFPDHQTAISHFEENSCLIQKPVAVIVVCSSTKNIKHREAIRKTWANDAKFYNITVLFLMGQSQESSLNKKIEEESVKFKDIIVERFLDTYENLVLKSIFMLKWFIIKCQNTHFIMKLDDDAFVNVRNLHNYLTRVKEEELMKFLIGYVEPNSPPHRNRLSKWYLPSYMYPEQTLPNYTHGVGYAMSMYVAKKLYQQSLLTDLIHLEDVFLTGICSQKMNIPPIDEKLFHFYESPIAVNCSNATHLHLIILSHHVHPHNIYKMYEQLQYCYS